MKESYECEVASHIGPELGAAAREAGVEALTGNVRAGSAAATRRNYSSSRAASLARGSSIVITPA
jgi:hypothetical protein